MCDDFFGPLPEPPPEPQPRVEPPWFGPPSGTLPGVVPLELVLARSATAAVCVTRVSAYPTGFEFDLLTLTDPDSEEDLDPHMFGPHRRRGRAEADQRLRLGVQFSDGAKATNVGAGPGISSHSEEPRAGRCSAAAAVVAAAAAGVRTTGCGHSRRSDRSPSFANGQQHLSP